MKKIKFINKIAIIFVIIMIITILVLNKVNKIANPILMVHAKANAYNTVTKIINNSVNDSIQNLNVNELFIMSYDNNGEIISIDFDSIVVNKVLTSVSLAIESEINFIEEEAYQVPFGVIFKNSFFTNLGPNIPVKLRLVGSVVNDIDTKITNYGINNALMEVYIDIEVNVQVVLPFISDNITVKTLMPIAIKLVRGNIPEYYSGALSTNPLLSIPIE